MDEKFKDFYRSLFSLFPDLLRILDSFSSGDSTATKEIDMLWKRCRECNTKLNSLPGVELTTDQLIQQHNLYVERWNHKNALIEKCLCTLSALQSNTNC